MDLRSISERCFCCAKTARPLAPVGRKGEGAEIVAELVQAALPPVREEQAGQQRFRGRVGGW
ncbi:hypothetical protein COR50_20200 [Chitinophaga caeni]|uniref:Uncharacterized protein n=1 Tax=Chitinophaga caeni TaxID=2029983 RepID=A0A291QZ58_9BACT|nr:hypothetical protein COR50_20200 [Chitinophaga caeni]